MRIIGSYTFRPLWVSAYSKYVVLVCTLYLPSYSFLLYWNYPYLHKFMPRGGTRSIHDGGTDIFFWVKNLHALYFFGSRDLSHIFLGLKKIRIYFWVLSPSELFVSVFRCHQRIRKIFIRTDARYLCLGLKFQACVFFWVCIMKLRRSPLSCIL